MCFFPPGLFSHCSKKELNFNIKLHQILKALDCSLNVFEEYSYFCDILQCLLNSIFQMILHTLLCKQPSESFTYFIISLSCLMIFTSMSLYYLMISLKFSTIYWFITLDYADLAIFLPLSPSNMCTLFLIPSSHIILQFWLYEQSVFKLQ